MPSFIHFSKSNNSGRSSNPASVTNKSNNINGDRGAPSSSSNSPTISATSTTTYSQSWKVVGSPPTNVIRSVPQSPDEYQAFHSKKSDDDNREKLRRTPSTTNTPITTTASQRHLNGGVSELTSRLLSTTNNTSSTPTNPSISPNNSNTIITTNSPPLPLTQQSIVNITNGSSDSISSVNNNANNGNSKWGTLGGKLPVPVPPNPQYRQHRSLSFSVGQHDTDLFGYAPISSSSSNPRRESEAGLRFAYRHALPVMEEETDDLSNFNMKFRARSKSSAAAYGAIPPHPEFSDDISEYRRESEQYSDSGSIWNGHQASSIQNDPPILHHRRSIPGASDYGGGGGASSNNGGGGGMWDSFSAHRQQNASSSYLAMVGGLPGERERLEKLRQRRFSLSQVPTYNHDYQYMDGGQDLRLHNHRTTTTMDPSSIAHLVQRRHSVAGPSISFTNNQQTRYISEALESLHLSNVQPASYTNDTSYASIPEDIDDYFDNDEHRTRAWNELGKGLPLHAIPPHGPLFLVEFKAGRTDLFYVAENSGVMVKKGDLVIVEADRGKDLGHRVSKEIHPKRIYRLAQPQEITMLVTKSQDEAKAMLVCQTKVRQKKLPMEVVDAEYQW
nr:14562_t:CDS:2 [Entrophospora candida]